MSASKCWRSMEPLSRVDMVEIPHGLALDLVKCLGVSHFLHCQGFSDDELGNDRHMEALEEHRKRMERMESTLAGHLCDEGLTPSADLILRSLTMAYEVAEDIQVPA